jgi:hypothetical protein
VLLLLLLSLCAGLSMTSRGFTVYHFIPLTGSIVVHEGLTLDAAWGHCNFDRSTTPVVYLHRPHDAAPQQVTITTSWHCMHESSRFLGSVPDNRLSHGSSELLPCQECKQGRFAAIQPRQTPCLYV